VLPLVLGILLAFACGRVNEDSGNTPVPEGLETRLESALVAILGPRSVAPRTLRIERRTWRSDCLEIEPPGAVCQGGPVVGYEAVLQYDVLQYVLHSNDDASVVMLRPREQVDGVISIITPNLIEIETPERVQAAILRSTNFVTPLAELKVGTRVTLALEPQPSTGVPALIWLAVQD
jgi:hypothetical protein